MHLLAQSLSHLFKRHGKVAIVAGGTHPTRRTRNYFQLRFAKPKKVMCVAGRPHHPYADLSFFYISDSANSAVRDFDAITIVHGPNSSG